MIKLKIVRKNGKKCKNFETCNNFLAKNNKTDICTKCKKSIQYKCIEKDCNNKVSCENNKCHSCENKRRWREGKIKNWIIGRTKETDERVAKLLEKGKETRINNGTLSFTGEMNGMYNKGYLLFGDRNGRYGTSPPKEASKGLYGHIIINDIKMIFRSSLELKVYIFLFVSNINFKICDKRIKYVHNGISKTYLPDIEINDKIYEIKPSGLLQLEKNILKINILKNYCMNNNLEYDIITENTYDLNFINREYVDKMIECGIVDLGIKEKNLLKYERCF